MADLRLVHSAVDTLTSLRPSDLQTPWHISTTYARNLMPSHRDSLHLLLDQLLRVQPTLAPTLFGVLSSMVASAERIAAHRAPDAEKREA